MPSARVIRSCIVDGTPAKVGDVVNVSDATFVNLSRKGWLTADDAKAEPITEAEPPAPTTKKRSRL